MTEILTESFCERCGTRYTFEPEARRGRLKGIGTLGRGIRHFVTDPGSSLDEAFAVARSEQDQRSTTHALEAFHRTFNFCLNCRQYTCGDCWNTVEGRCLTCAPTPESMEIPEPRMDTAISLPPIEFAPSPAPIGAEPIDAGPWIGSEAELLEKLGGPLKAPAEAAAARAAAEAEARATAEAEARAAEELAARVAEEAEAARVAAEDEAIRVAAEEEAARVVAEAESASAAAELEAALVAAEAEALAAAEAERVAAEEEARAAEAAAQAPAFEPGLNLDDQIADYERRVAESPEAAEAEAEAPPAAAEAEAEPVSAEAGAEAVTAEPEPEPVAAEEIPLAAAAASATAPVEPIPTAVGQPLPASVVDGPLAWPEPGVAAAAFEPAWPDLPTPRRSTPATGALAALPPVPPPPVNVRTTGAHLPGITAAPQPLAAHACPSCGLSLSANARFCRRCGTPQQVAAQR